MAAGGAAPPKRLSNLQLRIVSGVILAIVALGLTWAGGWPFKLLCGFCAVAIFAEWTAMTVGRSDRLHQLASGAVLVLALLLAFAGWLDPRVAAAAAIGLCLAAGLVRGRWGWTLAGLAYALLPGLALAFLRGSDREGFWAILLLFAVVWATDIFAYFVGRALRGPKLAPAVSPGKTWSGAVGGTVAGVLAGFGVGVAAHAGHPLELAALALPLSVVSQAGDLLESWVKRLSGVKDSGWLIPGHGGVMDRVDGLVAAAVALYGLALLFSGSVDPAAWLFRA